MAKFMQLERSDYIQVKHLLNEHNSHYPLMEAVLLGDLEGRVFVNDYPQIRAALIVSRLDWVYVIGEDADTDFASEVISILSQKKSGSYIWFGASKLWRDHAEACISNDIQDYPRFRYQFSREKFGKREACDKTLKINAVDADNYDCLYEKYRSSFDFWDSKEGYLSKGFGFFVEDNGAAVSLIVSASVTDNEAEIDIHTDELFRGRGYAKQLAIRFIEECLTRRLQPKWDCYSKNEPSIQLAAWLGFERVEEYPLIFITLK